MVQTSLCNARLTLSSSSLNSPHVLDSSIVAGSNAPAFFRSISHQPYLSSINRISFHNVDIQHWIKTVGVIILAGPQIVLYARIMGKY